MVTVQQAWIGLSVQILCEKRPLKWVIYPILCPAERPPAEEHGEFADQADDQRQHRHAQARRRHLPHRHERKHCSHHSCISGSRKNTIFHIINYFQQYYMNYEKQNFKISESDGHSRIWNFLRPHQSDVWMLQSKLNFSLQHLEINSKRSH